MTVDLSGSGEHPRAAAAGADPEVPPGLVDEIANGLDDGPIHVDPAAAARIPDAAIDTIEEKADAVPHEVFVILVGDEVPGRDLAELVHAQTDQPGIYLVTSPRGLLWHDVFDDGSGSLDGVTEALSAEDRSGSGYEGVRLLQEALDALAEQAGAAAEAGAGEPAEGTLQQHDGPGGYGLGSLGPHGLLLAVLVVGIVVAVVVTRMLTAARTRRERRDRQRARIPAALLENAARMQREQIRAALADDTLDLARDLSDFETADLTSDQAAIVRHGLDAYTFAGRLVDGEDATRADLAGALVLVTASAQDLARVGTGAAPRSLCTVDPTHGEATARRAVRDLKAPPGGQRRMGAAVPVCRQCADDLRVGRRPQWLMDRGRPYVDRDTVWSRTLFGTDGGDLVALVQEELAARG